MEDNEDVEDGVGYQQAYLQPMYATCLQGLARCARAENNFSEAMKLAEQAFDLMEVLTLTTKYKHVTLHHTPL